MRLVPYVLVLCIVLCACNSTGVAEDGDALSCGDRENDVIQILTSRLDAGIRTRDSYRVSTTGDLSRASWTDNNVLLGIAESTNIGADAFQEAKAILPLLEQSHSTDESENTTLYSPKVFTVEFANANADRPLEFVFHDLESEALNTLIQDWNHKTPLQAVEPGNYIWTMPAPPGSGPTDISISRPDCDVAINSAVNAGTLNSDVVVPVSNQVAEFGKKERARYIARSAHGFIFFGILSSP